MATIVARLILFLSICCAVVVAQPGRPDDQRGWERIEQLRKVRLIELLDMKEEQSVRFFTRLKEHDGIRHQLMQQRDQALDRIEQLLKSNAAPEEYAPVFQEVNTIDGKMLTERGKFFDGLSDILSVEQRAKFLVFERKFERELREAFREAQRRRHPGEEQ